MERIKNSISSFSVRTLPRNYKISRKIGCSHRKAHQGLSSDHFMPIGDVDLMAFYVQRKMDRSKQAPEDILKLIEQLTNVEEKVKAMEEKLGSGGVRHRHLDVMAVKENANDKPSADQRRKKTSRKRKKGARCLCFPWSCRRDINEKEEKKKTNKAEGKSRVIGKKDVTEALKNASRGSRVSWDEGITVRYIGDESSAEELIDNKSRRNKRGLRKAYNDEESPEESPAEDDVKNIVHVKIRIPKQKKQSNSNIIEITGQNIEDDDDPLEIENDVKNAAVLKMVKEEAQVDAPPDKELIDEGLTEVLKPSVTLKTADSIRAGRRRYDTQNIEPKDVSEKMQQDDQTLGKSNESNNDADAVNSVDMGDSLKAFDRSDFSEKNEPEQKSSKKKLERDIISETNSDSEHKMNHDSRRSSGKKSEITTETKNPHSRRPSTSKRDESLMEEQDGFEHPEENSLGHVTPIALVEHSNRTSQPPIVGIPIKEPGRSSCGSQGCRCRGSTRNDSNLFELKKSLHMNASETTLLDRIVETSPEPEEMNVNTGFGLVNVVTHPYDCDCIICETFGSKKETSVRRNSVRSDTGAVISKRVVRVRYNENFRNVLTHTEECGCALCINIDEEMYKNRSKRSTQMSTRDSVLFVHNKGLCGCKNCKTVTTFKKESIEMEQYKRDMEQQIKDYEEEMRMNHPEAMASRTSYRTIDPCYYSQATVPSMNSFPKKHSFTYDNRETACPSIDSLDSSEEEMIWPKNNHKHKEIVVNPKTKRLSLKRDERETNKSIIIVSAKPITEPEGLKDPYSDEWQQKSDRRKGGLRKRYGFTRRSPDGEYGRVASDFQYKNSNKQDAPYKHPKPKNKRNKVGQDQPHDQERERVDNNKYDLKRWPDESRGRKFRKNSKRADRSEQKSRKHPKEHRVTTNGNAELEDPQTTLEEIIKDLVSGRSDESEDKTYTVTLGRIHNKPYTKVKIIDCSKPRIESCSSILSSDTLQCTSYDREESSSAVYFSKPFPSISVSPTCSSNFARSGGTSVVNLSHSLLTNNYCHVSDPVRQSCSQSISPSPSLLIISSLATDEIAGEDWKPKEDLKLGEPATTKVVTTPTTRSALNQEISILKTRQRPKKSKFKIKLGGKVRSFFKRNERKKMPPVVTTVNNDIQ